MSDITVTSPAREGEPEGTQKKQRVTHMFQVMCYQYVYVGVTVGVVVPCVIGHTPVMYLTVTMVKGGMLVYHTA